jgi:hypothetical protein
MLITEARLGCARRHAARVMVGHFHSQTSAQTPNESLTTTIGPATVPAARFYSRTSSRIHVKRVAAGNDPVVGWGKKKAAIGAVWCYAGVVLAGFGRKSLPADSRLHSKG